MPRPKGTLKTGGRAKGTPNRRTQEMINAARETALRVLGEDAFAGDAHALLQMVYRDPNQPIELRVDAAKAAIGYESPRLQAIDARVTTRREVRDLTDEELLALIAPDRVVEGT